MRKEKGRKRGRKRMDDREKEGEVEERVEVPELPEERVERREEEEIQEGPAIGEGIAEEEERCEDDPECHSSAKRARVCATFTVTKFPLWNFSSNTLNCMTRNTQDSMTGPKGTLWAEIAAELKLQPFDVRRWFESQRTRYGKLSKLQSGQAPREMTKRQSWVYQQMGFLKPTSEERGPTEVQVLRPVRIPAGRTNHVGQLLTQNISSQVS